VARDSSVILFLVQRRKAWLSHTAQVRCSNTANIGECKTWMQSEFCSWQNSNVMAQKCIYSVPPQKTAKHRALTHLLTALGPKRGTSAGIYANHLHLSQTDNHTDTSSQQFLDVTSNLQIHTTISNNKIKLCNL